MRCAICKKEDDEVELFEGISADGMIRICRSCSINESIPTIQKPSVEQLDMADERYSVRERMERMSGMRDKTEISKEQIRVQGNIAKLKMPGKKQQHQDVLDNYYWTLNMARRRRKLSIRQLAEKVQVEPSIIESIERGKIPENFEEVFLKLESFLGVRFLKSHNTRISFTRKINEEREILEAVQRRMENVSTEKDDDFLEEVQEKKEALDRLSRGEMDFSKREEISNVTLSDLVEMKREREQRETKRRTKIQTDALIGEDLDLDIEEEP